MAQREIFTCEKCGVAQAVSGQAKRSHTCMNPDCNTVYAVVATPDGEKALVPYFHQA